MRTAVLALALLAGTAVQAQDRSGDLDIKTGRFRTVGDTAEVLLQVRNGGAAAVEVAEVSCAVVDKAGEPLGEARSVVRNIKAGATVAARNLIGIREADGKLMRSASCRVVDAR